MKSFPRDVIKKKTESMSENEETNVKNERGVWKSIVTKVVI